MTAALLDTYEQIGLIRDAINLIVAEAAAANNKRDKEIAIDASLAEIAGKIGRNELDAEPTPEPVGPSAAELAGMREEIKDLIANGAHGARNALFRALVHEVQVTGRHKIKPFFRVPINNRTPGDKPGVRMVTNLALPAPQNANHFLVIEGPVITLSLPRTRRAATA